LYTSLCLHNILLTGIFSVSFWPQISLKWVSIISGPRNWSYGSICGPRNQRWKKSKNVRTLIFVIRKMSLKLCWGNSSKSAIISYLTSFQASNQTFVSHFYPWIRILILIPQYSSQNKSKSPHKSKIVTYVRDT
jgi:hypothetical protein